MDKSFYGLDGYEPHEVYKDQLSIVNCCLCAHLCQATGVMKPNAIDSFEKLAKDIKRNLALLELQK